MSNPLSPNNNNSANILNYAGAIATLVFIVALTVIVSNNTFELSTLAPYRSLIIKGFFNTILVSIISLAGSMILGFVLYVLSISKIGYFRALSDVFTELMYGTPMLVLIFVMGFVVGPAYGSFNRPLWGVIAIILYMAPYMMNVLKAAISSIPEEQYMAMELFGFTKAQKYRYLIIPQVIRILMPPLMNNFSLIIKGSALLNVISYPELFYAIRVSGSKTLAFTEGYVLMWGLYLIITIPLSQVTKYLERRFGS
jgi:polar amino acid transport system permease protein